MTLNPGAIMSSDALPTLHIATLERMAIRLALTETRGNRVRAARLLGIHVRTLHRKLHEPMLRDVESSADTEPQRLVAV